MREAHKEKVLSDRRGTIYVTRQLPEDPKERQRAMERDKKWHGAAPRVVPETDRNFRPKDLLW